MATECGDSAERRGDDLQDLYGGRYIASRDGAVIASAESYGALISTLDAQALRDERLPMLVIEYVKAADRLAVY